MVPFIHTHYIHNTTQKINRTEPEWDYIEVRSQRDNIIANRLFILVP